MLKKTGLDHPVGLQRGHSGGLVNHEKPKVLKKKKTRWIRKMRDLLW